MNNNVVIKQLIVNNINLPYDMLNIIKDYAFVDIISAQSKYYKKIVDNVIKNAICSSVVPYFGNVWYDPENDPWTDDDDDYDDDDMNPTCYMFWGEEDDLQFQSYYCLDCGNHIVHDYDDVDIPDNIICKCDN